MTDDELVASFNYWNVSTKFRDRELYTAFSNEMETRGYTRTSDKSGGVDFVKGDKKYNIG